MKKIFVLFFIILNISFAQEIEENNFNDDFSNEFIIEEKKQFDPLSGYNRAMTSFNDFFYLNILEPTAKGYAIVVPETARVGISNFFNNLTFPIRFVNNILQLKFDSALQELGRFAVNTTFGLAGFMDPASEELQLYAKKEDFGQTLGHYGIGEGFHLVLPFFGPSNLRDTIGLLADGYVNPLTTSNVYDDKVFKVKDREKYILSITNVINDTSLNPNRYETLTKDAIDLYPFLRDTYNQKREKEIKE
ncbi:ABC transporter [Halarcobacter mediterraneus]|uniref:ABC transporter n=1 Tax=Halarcobacter mediterraneus TaxID=2023153 RepID=A0A4Q1B0R8_9BACT|nr:VacJ family lipoprotein [Halarcobacter mediterraneus]RXK13901.1 ABC transporter [Halarcobacter mediterraneus]